MCTRLKERRVEVLIRLRPVRLVCRATRAQSHVLQPFSDALRRVIGVEAWKVSAALAAFAAIEPICGDGRIEPWGRPVLLPLAPCPIPLCDLLCSEAPVE